MQISEYGVIINVINHGENNAIITALTQNSGVIKGYAKRIQNKKKVNPFAHGNVLKISLLQREGTLGVISGEPYKMYMYSVMHSHKNILLIQAMCEILTFAFTEHEKQKTSDIFARILIFLEGIKHEIPFEENVFNLSILIKHILNFCGYAFRLDQCIATGVTEELLFLSPKSGSAVSKNAGEAYQNLMFSLPGCFITDSYKDVTSKADINNCLEIIDYFVHKNLHKKSSYIQKIIEYLKTK